MQLAPLQMLAPVAAVGAAAWGLGSALPADHGARTRALGGLLVLVTGVVALLYVLFLSVGMALEEDPALAAIPVGLLALLAFLAMDLAGRRNRPPTPRPKGDEDGGGGQRRPHPKPSPRTPPAPASPDPGLPGAPWDQFDDLRSQWERVPAGTR